MNAKCYVYDPIGNRVFSAVNALTNAYTANRLNQYTAVTGRSAVSPTYDADGYQKSAKPKAEPPGDRDFEAMHQHGVRSRNRRRNGNGNMTSDGGRTLAWDCENRLQAVTFNFVVTSAT